MKVTITTENGAATVTVSDQQQEISITLRPGDQPAITSQPASSGRKADK